METATTNQILSLVQHDLGIGFCPETLAKDSIKRGEVVEISVKEHANPRDICLITRIPPDLSELLERNCWKFLWTRR